MPGIVSKVNIYEAGQYKIAMKVKENIVTVTAKFPVKKNCCDNCGYRF